MTNLNQLAAELRQDPRRYLWFGPWWWTVKRALNAAGQHFGHEDEPGTRAILEGQCSGPDDALKRAMRHYEQNKGALRNHNFTLSGQPYFLHDDEVTMYSRV